MALHHRIPRFSRGKAGYPILHVKIRHTPRRGLRLRWLLVSCSLVATAFGLAIFWQHVQKTPIEVIAVSRSGSASSGTPPTPEDGAPSSSAAPEPFPVGIPRAPDAGGPTVGASPDFSVPYQVEESAPVTDEYFSGALFVGDSLTTGISLYHVMDNAQVIASTGLNPNTILSKPIIRDAQGTLHTVLEAMSGSKPDKIYVELGVNGLAWISLEDFTARYEELIDAIRSQHPDALLYVQSILPVTREKSLGENGIYSNEKIDAYNTALMNLCEEKGVAYLNLAEAFKESDGALAPGASPDGIHFGADYYERWMNYLKTHTVPAP